MYRFKPFFQNICKIRPQIRLYYLQPTMSLQRTTRNISNKTARILI